MTDTEKILNLLEINENIPALVIDDESNIVSGNFRWSKLFHSHESGKSFYKYFDKNTSLLVKNSVLDAKTFFKTQRREINLEVDNNTQKFNLLISPFQLDKKLYCFVFLIDHNPLDELHVYPTSDIKTVTTKYNRIIDQLKESLPKSLVEKKNFQYQIDIEKEPIAIKDNVQYLFKNKSFDFTYNLSDLSNKLLTSEDIFSKNLLTKIKLVENEIYNTKLAFVIEEKVIKEGVLQLNNRILLLPILSKENVVSGIMIIGTIESESKLQKPLTEFKESGNNQTTANDISAIDNAAEAKIIYDRNNYDILNANFIAAKIYGYDLEEFKGMNITELFPPEEMQKLLMYSEENGNYIFDQLKSDGSIISINVIRENIKWEDREACLETISLNQPEEEVIDLEEDEEEKHVIVEKPKSMETKREFKSENKSEFLSSLFHEILTPVNVILGFVQEIIDSVDTPTEEQKESAQIIKDNQQMLLQTMNTAAQFAQLNENKINLRIEEFDLNKYLVDLNDSYSRDAEKANIKVVLDDIPDSLNLKHDRSKLLAAISYLVKFVLKLTKSSKINLSLKVIDEKLHFLVKDSEMGIDENVVSDLLEIFNNQQLSKKKNYGISPISIKLANLLNNLLSVKIKEFSDSNTTKTIALVTTINFENSEQDSLVETLVPETELVEIPSDVELHEPKAEEILSETDMGIEDIIKDEMETESNINSEIEQDIPNGKVDEKIVEDIEDEEEIVTEEIATVEETEEQIIPQEIVTQEDEDAEPANLAELSCLFIDDSIDAQLLFKSQMDDFKQLKVSPNLTEALPLLNKHKFDLIIVDIHLNDKYNGLDALKIIRQFNNYKDTPIFAITAYPFEKDREKFLNFGFTDYFVKPFLKEQLIDSLAKILS